MKNEKARGFSDEQLTQALLNRGPTPEEVEQAFSALSSSPKPAMHDPNASFYQAISEKGSLFKGLFYFLIVVFGLQLLGLIGFTLFNLAFIGTFFNICVGVICFLLLKQKKFFYLLMIIFIMSPIGIPLLAALPLIHTYVNVGNMVVYLFIFIYTLVLGLFSAYMFSKVSTSKNYLIPAITVSSLFAIAFAFGTMISRIINALATRLTELSNEVSASQSGGMLSLFRPEGIFNSNIGFVLAFVCFNIFYLVFYHKRKDMNPRHFFLYLIPIIVFFITSLILNSLASSVLTAFGP